MALTPALQRAAVLALVASDHSYGTGQMPNGEKLRSTPDNEPEDEQAFPTSLLFTFTPEERDASFSPYHTITGPTIGGVATIEFDNWVVDARFANSGNGFGAVIFRSRFADASGKYDYVAAFRGTDGPNGQDWFANLDLAKTVWESEGAQVVNALAARNAKSIIFAGQSLGGGLSQYGLYDYVSRLKATNTPRPELSLITFNGFGGVRGLQQLPGGYDSNLVSGIPTAHIVIENDIVHKLGAGAGAAPDGSWHVNGAGNFHKFTFPRFTQFGSAIARPDGVPAIPNLVEAHRLESGFYRGLQHSASLFGGALTSVARVEYLDSAQSQTLAAALSRVFNKGLTTEMSAWARCAVGVAAVAVAGPPEEINKATRLLTSNFYLSGQLPTWARDAINNANPGYSLKIAARPAGNIAAAATALATTIELFEGLTTVDRDAIWNGMNRFMPAGRQIPPRNLSNVSELQEGDKALLAHAAMLSLGRYATDEETAAMFPDLVDREFVAAFREADVDEEEFFQAIDSGTSSLRNILVYLGQAIVSSDTLSVEEEGLAIQRLGLSMARIARRAAGDDEVFIARVRNDLNGFLQDVARAIANADPGALEQAETPITLAPAANYSELRSYADGFLAGLKQFGEAAIAALTGSTSAGATELDAVREQVQAAAQAIAVKPFGTSNPFNDEAFNPHEETDSGLSEHAGRGYTIFLPYEAAEGGQRVRLKLEGDGAGTIRAVAHGEALTVTNGEFEVLIAEGERALTFALTQTGDVDTESSVALSATLINADGEETHETQVELDIELNAAEEPEWTQPATTREIVGDLEPEEATDTLPGYGSARFPKGPMWFEEYENGAFVDVPENWIILASSNDKTYLFTEIEADGTRVDHYTISQYTYLHHFKDDLDNAIRSEVPDAGREDFFLDSAGNDHIVTGGGDDSVAGVRGGDDFIEAGGGDDDVQAGEGQDWVEGGGGTDVLNGEGGDDVILGGEGRDIAIGAAGKDRIEGGSEGDILDGLDGDDMVYADSSEGLTLAEAIEAGESGSQAEGPGDLMSGNAGEDILVGGAGADYIAGGNDADVIVGGAGDDTVYGDQGVLAADLSWSVTRTIGEVDGVTTYTVTRSAAFTATDGEGADDVVYGGAGADWIFAAGGDDYVEAGADDDVVLGEAGNDALSGGSGNDVLDGDSVPANAEGTFGDDWLDGGAGDDFLYGGKGSDTLFGDDGDDRVSGDEGDDILSAGLGDDQVLGGAGVDEAYGGEGADTIDGGAGADYVDGGDGDDQIQGGAGEDHILGGEGADVIVADAGAAAPEAGDADVVEGGAGDDVVFGQGGDDELYGDEGADQIQGGEGDDALSGGGDDDSLIGDAGDDILTGGLGADVLDGGAGQDTYVYNLGDGVDVVVETAGDAADASVLVFQGGITRDHVTFRLEGSLVLDLGDGDAVHFQAFNADDPLEAQVLGSIEFSDGTAMSYADMLDQGFDVQGGEGGDVLHGSAVTDRIVAQAGADVVEAGRGDDRVDAGEGDDIVDAGDGNDEISTGAGADTVFGGAGDDTVFAGEGDTLIDGEGANSVDLTDYAGLDVSNLEVTQYQGDDGESYLSLHVRDDLNPGATPATGGLSIQRGELGDFSTFTLSDGAGGFVTLGVDELLSEHGAHAFVYRGRDADEALNGTQHDDTMFGGGGNDSIEGNGGDDRIDGGAGDDVLAGGEGDDAYLLAFNTGRDSIYEDAAAEPDAGHTIQLDAGVTTAMVYGQRVGDDLELRLRATEDALVVKDFYLQPQAWQDNWQVKDAAGNAHDVASFLEVVPPSATNWIEEQVAAYRVRREQVFAANRQGEGYGALGGNSFQRVEHSFGYSSASTTTTTTTRQLVVTGLANNLGYQELTSEFSSTPLGGPSVEYSLGRPRGAGAGGGRSSVATGWVGGGSTTGADGGEFVPISGGFPGLNVGGVQINPGDVVVPIYIPRIGRATSIHESGAGDYATGGGFEDPNRWQLSGYKIYRAGGGAGAAQPGQVTSTSASFVYDQRLTVEDLSAGAGANEIAGATSVVDGGGGDDTITLEAGDFFAGPDWEAAFSLADADPDSGAAARSRYLGRFPGLDGLVLRYPERTNLLGGFAHGGEGSDTITGSVGRDVLAGGDGSDVIEGGSGSDRYLVGLGDTGIDSISDSGIDALAYLDHYYWSRGILNWDERAEHAGEWRLSEDGPERFYFKTEQEADAAAAGLNLFNKTFIEALPEAAPALMRDDALYGQLVAAGVLSSDILEFGPGLELEDLQLTVSVDSFSAADHPERPWVNGGTVSVRWGSGSGVDFAIGALDSGHEGPDLLAGGAIFLPGTGRNWPGGWHGYRLGEGIESFRFSDGTVLGIDELLADATVVPIEGNYIFRSGYQLVDRRYPAIELQDGIRASDVRVQRDGLDLVVTVPGLDGAPTSQARIRDWFADPANMPGTRLMFEFDADIEAETLTALGLGLIGTDGDDVLVGAPAFSNTIAGNGGDDTLIGQELADELTGGSGNDLLDGGAGKDTYYFNRGDGADTVVDAPSGQGDPDGSVIVFGEGIAASDVQLTLGSLVLDLGQEDSIRFSAFDADDPYATPVFERLDFADGSSLFYEDILAGGFTLNGTAADDVISGTGINDIIWGFGGDDTLSGRGGEGDQLDGGDGDDVLSGGAGDFDNMLGGEGNDTYLYARGEGIDFVDERDETPGETDTVRLIGLAPSEVRVSRDLWSYYLLMGDGDQLVLDEAAMEAAAAIERVEFEDGTVWTDVADRVELVSATEEDDALWGTAGGDTIEGLGGYDQLYGNGGDDSLIGGEEGDTYYFFSGDGSDTIDNYDSSPESWDQLWFVDASSTDVSLIKSGGNLVLDLGGGDSVTLLDWYTDPSRKIDSVSFDGDGGYWDAAMLEAMAPTPDQTLIGTDGNDTLVGGSGNDLLDGGLGTDTMIGALGNDTYVVNKTADVVIENADEGTDAVLASATYTLSANVENLTLTGASGIRGTGNELANTLTGNAAGNVLDGGAGADTLDGGAGNDTYIVDDPNDVVMENAGEGTDTMKTSVSHALGDNVENLTLTGTDAITGTGNALNNVMTGNLAASTLSGSVGNDTYVISDAGTVLVENAGEGTDTVRSPVSYTLADNVENLTLTGTAAIDGTGNAANNVLSGNAAANVLTGADGNDTLKGGGGGDTLIGGAGNDIYVVDNADDVVLENASEGTDLVKASLSYVLDDDLENLTLTGSAAIDGTGNALNNVLTGNAAANVLAGGLGDDTYVVDAADTLVENTAEGVDMVKSASDYTLGANLENLTLTGTASLNGFGNGLDNVIRGNSGANLLGGDEGDDTVIGNAANDILQGGSGNDRLTDNGANNLLDGGAGGDSLTGSAGNELMIGGSGNDTVKTNTGADIIAFNRGDGQDTVAASQGADNTLSLGGGIGYQDLSFKKSGSALILQLGTDPQTGLAERITLSGWYLTAANNKSVAKLQVIAEAMADFDPGSSDPLLNKKIQGFDFLGLAGAFDAARTANPALTSWALGNALLQNHLGGSDTEAVGGDLTYGYGKNGTLAGTSLATAQQVLGAPEFGIQAQGLTPVFVGGEGDERLLAGPGNSLLAGGAGADSLSGAEGNDFLAGDAGNDAVETGAGANIVAFNKGGGTDLVTSATGATNTLSLGGGIGYEDLSLAKSGNDLIVHAGGDDNLVLKDWYAGKDNVQNLQLILDATDDFDAGSSDPFYNRKVQSFDFLGLVSEFDQALAQSPGLTSWAVTNALLQFHLSGADDSALGGDLAYWYGKNAGFAGISLAAAQQVIGASGFGSEAQSLRPFNGLQEGFVKLT